MKMRSLIFFTAVICASAFGSDGYYEGRSSTAYRTCHELSRPDHKVWFEARQNLEREATQAAKRSCRLAGNNVCEVVSVGIGQQGSRCSGEALVAGGTIDVPGPESIFESHSRTAYRDCYKISNPDHLVWLEARKQMEDEAQRSGTVTCKRAGFSVCEVIFMGPKMSGSRCVIEAVIQGGK